MAADRLGLDAALIATLERLTVLSRQRMRGDGPGPRRSISLGASVDFADYRTYAPGDDLRRVDWNAYARLERLFLKIFEAEENARITLLIDCSTSMAGGEPPKSVAARRICAALAYIGLSSYDRVSVAGVTDHFGPYLPPRAGRDRIPEVWQFLSELVDGGTTALSTLADLARYTRGPGIAVVLSDFLTDSDWRRGLQTLKIACKQDVTVVQVLSPQELAPDLTGDLRLLDAETGQDIEVSVNAPALRQYRVVLEAYTAELQQWCRVQGMGFLRISSATPLTQVLVRLLQPGGTPR